MNFKTVTLTAPTSETVTLGNFDKATLSGYTLTGSSIQAAERQVFSSNLPLVAGGIVAPGRVSVRRVELSGLVIAPTDEAAYLLARALYEVVRDRGVDPVVISYNPDGVAAVELEGFLTGEMTVEPFQGGPWLSYTMTLECPDPIAKGEPQSDVITSPITNAGNANTWPTVVVALSGTVTSVRIGSTTTAEFVQLDGLAGTETEVVVSTRPGFETVEVDGVAALDKLTLDSTFFPLVPGDNDLYVTVLAGGGSATATVDWRDGWVF